MWIEIRAVCKSVLVAAGLLTWSYLIMVDRVFNPGKSNDVFADFFRKLKNDMAAFDKGTRCSLPAFMRPAGAVHI